VPGKAETAKDQILEEQKLVNERTDHVGNPMSHAEKNQAQSEGKGQEEEGPGTTQE
jgi:hypothetical protein